jgi:outer membrane protein
VYKRKAKDLQDRYQDFQQKGSQGLLSENQTRQAQEELAKGKAELDQMEATHQQMMEEMQIDNEKALKMLTDYIKDYNKSSQYNYILSYSSSPMSAVLGVNDSLDITNEIIEGLNLQYRAKKGK